MKVKFSRSHIYYIAHMGNDLTVVNAARVSFKKHHDELDASDEKLIAFLAAGKHFSPFTHPQLQLRVKAPLFVARQMWKSHIGISGGDAGYMAWNEVSRRYVSDEPEFYLPGDWRLRADNVKQGSSEEIMSSSDEIYMEYESSIADGLAFYSLSLERGMCPEQARIILPQSMMTEWYWTGSLAAWVRIVGLRADKHALSLENKKLIHPLWRTHIPYKFHHYST